MRERFLTNFSSWSRNWGEVALWVWRLFFYPFLCLVLYALGAYLNTHYVSKEYFDKAMATLSQEKQQVASEQKQDLKDISSKLDALLLRDGVDSERLTELERRISRQEDKADK